MTEKEAIEILRSAISESEKVIAQLSQMKELAERKNRVGEYYSNIQNCRNEIESCKIAVKALEEIQQYREIGTVEACREAAEKQKAKRPRIHKERFSSTYSCQKCGCVLIHKDETGWFCGRHYKFCPDCGEPIDWSEEE